MPLSTITWAIARTEIDDATRWRTLVVLANHADDTGLCWPKCETVATAVARSDRQVRDHLSALVDDGYLERVRVRRNGRLGGYLYRVLAPGSRPVEADDLPGWAADTDLPNTWTRPIKRRPTTGGPPPDATGDPPPVDKRRSTAGQEVPSSEPPNVEQTTSTSPAVADDEPSDPFPKIATETTRRHARQLCRLLAAYVKPLHGIPKRGTSAADGWLVAMEKLVRIGPNANEDHDWPDADTAAQEIEQVIRWVFEVDNFWSAQIQSAGNLRKHYTQMRAKMSQPNGRGRTSDAQKAAKYRRLMDEGLEWDPAADGKFDRLRREGLT